MVPAGRGDDQVSAGTGSQVAVERVEMHLCAVINTARQSERSARVVSCQVLIDVASSLLERIASRLLEKLVPTDDNVPGNYGCSLVVFDRGLCVCSVNPIANCRRGEKSR